MKMLKIAILAQLDSQTITEQLAPELRKRGHTVDILDLSTVKKDDFVTQSEIQSLAKYDLVYYRSGLDPNKNTSQIIELETFLLDCSTQTINLDYTKHPQIHSKTYEAQQAEKNGLAIPKSIYSLSVDFSEVKNRLGSPFVIKTDFGTNGTGVHLVDTETDFCKVLASYPNTKLLLQEFIPHDFEYRVHIMAGEVACIWKKAPPIDDFRSNEAQGGEMLEADPVYTAQLTKLSQKTFSAFGFEIFVADFMLDKNTNEFYFTEINLNPGWSPIDEAAAGANITSLTADYFERICS